MFSVIWAGLPRCIGASLGNSLLNAFPVFRAWLMACLETPQCLHWDLHSMMVHGCSAPCGISPTEHIDHTWICTNVKGHPRMDDVVDATSQNNHNNKSSPQPLEHHWHSITFLVGGNMLSQVFPLGSWCGYGMLCTFHRHCRADLLGGPKKRNVFFWQCQEVWEWYVSYPPNKNH